VLLDSPNQRTLSLPASRTQQRCDDNAARGAGDEAPARGTIIRRYILGMSWRGFKRGLDELTHPPYLKKLSPEERKRRTRREWRDSELFFFFQAAEPRRDVEPGRASGDNVAREDRGRSDSPRTLRR